MKKTLSVVIAVIIIIFSCPFAAASTENTTPETVSNVIVFVKFKSAETETINTGKNYSTIKGYYDRNISDIEPTLDTSFKNYLSTISRGKLNVQNCFP